MGLKRSVGKRSFIDSVLDTIDDFYADVVQHLQEWQPPAPKLEKNKVEEADPPAVKGAAAIDSPDARTESNQSVEDAMDNAEGSLHPSGS